MSRLLPALALVASLLAGCAAPVSSLPPDSRIDVAQAYAEATLADASIAVVVGAVEVTDEGLAGHLGGTPANAAATYRDFFAQRLPVAFETARVGEVTVHDAAAIGLATARPADGERLALDADVVLLLDTLHVDRATYYVSTMGPPNPQTGAPTQQQHADLNLRIDTNVVLWDNRQGREIAAGRLDTETGIPPLVMGRATYEEAVREFVEQLARFTPLTLRD